MEMWFRLKRFVFGARHTDSWLVRINMLCVIGLCAVSAVMLLDMRRDAAQQAEISSRSLVQVLGRDIVRNIELYDLSLRATVRSLKSVDPADGNLDFGKSFFFSRAETAAGFGPIIVVNRSGTITTRTKESIPASSTVATSDFFRYFATHADTDLRISPPSSFPLDGKPAVILSRRLSNPDGSFAGVVFGAIYLDYFRGLFAAVGADHAGTVTLYGPSGKIVMREPYNERAIGQDVAEASSYAKMQKEKSGAFIGPAMNAPGIRHFVFAQVGDLPLRLSIGLSPDQIFSSWRWKAASLGACVLALCAITITLAWLFRRELRQRKQAQLTMAAANIELERQANTDSLTGLFNRRQFDDILSRECLKRPRDRQKLSLLMLDADCFKGFNDLYGHQKGDEALKVIACSIQAEIDPSSDVACRIGGEEFAVIFPDTEVAGALAAAERILSAVTVWNVLHAGSVYGILTVSGGVAQITEPSSEQPSDLVAAADAALYRAKALGRNRIEIGPYDPASGIVGKGCPQRFDVRHRDDIVA